MTSPAICTAHRLLAIAVLLANGIGGYGFVARQITNPTRTLPTSYPLLAARESEEDSATATATASTFSSSSSGSTSTLWISPNLSPLEAWCVTHMDVWYSQSLSIKCPFLKRRTADLLDGLDMMMRFLVIRHKSLDLIGPPPGCRSMKVSSVKQRHTGWDERLEIIRQDWRPQSHKGYYITGRLNTTIYRDDCFFNGPDPDMPVRGLRKYLNAASHLFDHATSSAELLSLEIVQVDSSSSSSSLSSNPEMVIVATWRLQGVLHLPWHPRLPVWTGRTTYHFDNDGLIHYHEEEWDISVAQAFLETLWPDFASRIWSKTVEENIGSSANGSSLRWQREVTIHCTVES